MYFKNMADKFAQNLRRQNKIKFSAIIIRKCLIAGTPLLAALSVGGSTSFPTVLLHQLTLNDSSIPLDFETSTWIGSIAGFAGLPSILVPSLMQWRGRKLAFILACLIVAVGWIVAFTAQNVASILISECLHGLGSNSVMAISFLSISEMTAPRYREMFMQMYFSSQMITMSVGGLLTHCLNWRMVAVVMFVPAVISLVCALMWPESPYWLAYKGDINKCIKSFVWLRGSDEAATKELDDLIKSKNENTIINQRNTEEAQMKIFWKIFRNKVFYLPALHMILLDFMGYWSGTAVVLIYSTELIKRSTHNEDVIFFSSFIMNSVFLLGFLCCIFFGKYLTNKTRLLCCTVVIICCLIGASSVTFMQNYGALSKNSLLCLIFLMFYSFFNGLGLTSSTYPLSSSLMPVKYRGMGGTLLIINSCVFHTTSLKVAPCLLVYIHMSGIFLVYASIAMICGILVWKFVPDTDGKTLQEIERFYTKGVWNDRDDKEHIKELQVIINDHL